MSDESAYRILLRSTALNLYYGLRKPDTYKVTRAVTVDASGVYNFCTLPTHTVTITSLLWNKTALDTPILRIVFGFISAHTLVIAFLLVDITFLLFTAVGKTQIVWILRIIQLSSFKTTCFSLNINLEIQTHASAVQECNRIRQIIRLRCPNDNVDNYFQSKCLLHVGDNQVKLN